MPYILSEIAFVWGSQKLSIQNINAIITFLIVAFALFMVIKGMNAAKAAAEEAEAEAEAAAEPSDEVKLLTEIRDALKSN